MRDRVTTEEAAELRRLEAAVPPGEWSHDLDCDDPEGTIANDNGGAVAFMCPFASVHTIDRTGGQTFCHDEARLIPAARNALPRLLDEIDRLRAELAVRPKLWVVRADTIEIGSVDIGDCGDAVPCIAAFDREIDASYVAACVGGTVEEWGAK